ncbi:hypothetical protein [Listeria fleischmannii]|uniref:Uncharacterized protein n=2 Tax=Listeria fleischmannii TaxID=1069827 RepID=W7DVL3_9LIST|nr:hypothetical protein [Listeria fleischmannii]EIA21149.1 hypothetical protein KKC_02849 [Listeria fleischmannii subsp. coloradonensis]EUJ51877.1 hypothetical protein MCOL2_14738 [Listeria fleischmannii FSL S10-1203]MBC1397883.1 hypothetical protein [Listeria fleischmannii]MBC1417460.1 hypothetical protein [Listeria fleischmannii]MBC1427352.1 hypothetical protein [Listeria fleischmannii]
MRKDTFNQKSVYIHMDNVINNVVTSGITFCDFMQGVTLPPENILLIKHHIKDSSYNTHTAFDFLEASDLQQLKTHQGLQLGEFCWIDFEDIDLVNQLSPQEVAEMLYLAHTGRHLRSPFYYKLQNNFVYLTKKDGRYNKTYYRNMNHFYAVLGFVVAKKTAAILNEKTFLSLNKRKYVKSPSMDLLKRFSAYFKEGACIAFAAAEKTRTQIRIPVGAQLDEDIMELEHTGEEIAYSKIVADLVYDLKKNEWTCLEK